MGQKQELTKEEMYAWLGSLLQHFGMDEGYPSTHVITMDGPEHGVVGDELGAILEDGIEMLGTLKEELDIEDCDFDIEFEMDF